VTDMVAASRQTPQVRIVAWLVLLVFETMAQIALKAGGAALSGTPFALSWFVAASQNHWVWAGVAGYLGAFAAWMVILDTIPLSFGFPLTAVILPTVSTASQFLFGEVLSPWRLGGIGLIVLGLLLMGGDDS